MTRAAVFTWPVRVYWEDTDAGGIVFYANYLKFFERARTEWLRSLGVSQGTLKDAGGGMFVVSETTVRYLQPARLDDELLVTAQLEAGGRASLIIAQRIMRKQSLPADPGAAAPAPSAITLSGGEAGSVGPLICEGTIRIGWVDAGSLRPGRIPLSILEVLNTKA